jgi:hypothetical protein
MAMMMIAIVIVITMSCDTVIAVCMVIFAATTMVSFVAFSQVATMLLGALAGGRTALIPSTLIASVSNKR